MSLPEDFLTQLEQYEELSQREREVFLRLFGKGMSRQQIALDLSISESNLNTCLSGIYRKFSISSDLGRGKENHLREYLTRRYASGKGTGSSISGNLDWDIDALVREVRQRIQPYIQEKCGTMRVLDMTQPVALGDIYTSVNILEKLTGRRGLELAELMRDTSPEKFERFCVGDVREQRVPGLKAVEKFSKLMILGKPGAGKTTFLKHLAIQCIGGEFQSDRVPVFITLKDFAESDGKPHLFEYITRLVAMSSVGTQHLAPLQPNVAVMQEILRQGWALILLDGLDEVKDADSSRVLRQIREFSQQFPQNQFVITCRIAAREYTFEQFTEVEIADFSDKQIADFSDKWFRSKNDSIKAERFLQKLKEDEPIRELATNPLLLTLLCLVFEDSGSFPTNRAELYQTGVDVLLKKWDVTRDIERDQVYKRLSLKRKEDLLSHIAHITFEAGNYFFKQREVERYINQYIQNLPDASTDPEALELDSAAVLKSIEAHHGLFVERARAIYSFSHLTFHEYFTAYKIVTSCNPCTVDDLTLQGLVSHLTETRWREVFLLVVEMLPSADRLLGLMKQQVDLLVANDEKLQLFLFWIYLKSVSIKDSYYKPIAIRIFYLCLEYVYGLGLFDFGEPIDLASRFHVDIHNIPLGIGSLDFESQLYQLLSFCCSSWFAPKDAITRNIDRIFEYFQLHPDLKEELQQLKNNLPEFPDPEREKEKFQELWADVRPILTKQLIAIMIKYCNIGYDWQFNEEQIELLRHYYDANEFLLECLDSDCYVSREVRQEIEETLLLPIAEIEKRQQQEKP